MIHPLLDFLALTILSFQRLLCLGEVCAAPCTQTLLSRPLMDLNRHAIMTSAPQLAYLFSLPQTKEHFPVSLHSLKHISIAKIFFGFRVCRRSWPSGSTEQTRHFCATLCKRHGSTRREAYRTAAAHEARRLQRRQLFREPSHIDDMLDWLPQQLPSGVQQSAVRPPPRHGMIANDQTGPRMTWLCAAGDDDDGRGGVDDIDNKGNSYNAQSTGRPARRCLPGSGTAQCWWRRGRTN